MKDDEKGRSCSTCRGNERCLQVLVGKKVKVIPLCSIEELLGERRYSSYSFLTSALKGVSGQHHTLAALFPRGKSSRYPLCRRLGGPRAGLDAEVRGKILWLCRGSNPSRLVCSQTLY
jgi:hypothetical protein